VVVENLKGSNFSYCRLDFLVSKLSGLPILRSRGHWSEGRGMRECIMFLFYYCTSTTSWAETINGTQS
jgi:hypothetical protein